MVLALDVAVDITTVGFSFRVLNGGLVTVMRIQEIGNDVVVIIRGLLYVPGIKRFETGVAKIFLTGISELSPPPELIYKSYNNCLLNASLVGKAQKHNWFCTLTVYCRS